MSWLFGACAGRSPSCRADSVSCLSAVSRVRVEVGFWEDYPGIMASYLTLEDASSDPNVTKIVNMMVQNNSCALLSELGPHTIVHRRRARAFFGELEALFWCYYSL